MRDHGISIVGGKASLQENCILHVGVNGEQRVANYVQLVAGTQLHNCVVIDYAMVEGGARVGDHVNWP